MIDKLFPIQRIGMSEADVIPPYPLKIPWSVAELAYSMYVAKFGSSQSLEHLAERGGFGPDEMDNLLPGWRELCSEISLLTRKNEVLRKGLLAIKDHEHCEHGFRCIANVSSEHQIKSYHHIEKYGDAQTGVRIGHRCCSTIAAKTLEEEENTK